MLLDDKDEEEKVAVWKAAADDLLRDLIASAEELHVRIVDIFILYLLG